jgi:NAD(P)-dependent dehydrogenase (short-subunit alcohol dehydrogenase family)
MPYAGLDLKGQCALVIGGTSGIGRTLALGLAEAGANVVVTGRRQRLIEVVNHELRERGSRPFAVTCDVTQRSSVMAFKDAFISEYGKLEVLVNCAGVTQRVPTLQVTEEEFQRVVDINLMGTLRGCQAFGGHMIERGYGRIINIASLASFVALFEVAAYNASKAAVRALTQTLAVEWGKHGVCVNAIAPGVFRTDMNKALLDGTERGREFLTRTPLNRFGHTHELVGATIFLASPSASFTNGQILAVDGGYLASAVNS